MYFIICIKCTLVPGSTAIFLIIQYCWSFLHKATVLRPVVYHKQGALSIPLKALLLGAVPQQCFWRTWKTWTDTGPGWNGKGYFLRLQMFHGPTYDVLVYIVCDTRRCVPLKMSHYTAVWILYGLWWFLDNTGQPVLINDACALVLVVLLQQRFVCRGSFQYTLRYDLTKIFKWPYGAWKTFRLLWQEARNTFASYNVFTSFPERVYMTIDRSPLIPGIIGEI